MRARSLVLVFGALALATVCPAAEPAAEQPGQQAAVELPPEEAAYRPLTFRAEGGQLGLLDAVRLTLGNDPNIRLRDVAVDSSAGRLRELTGQFDTVLRGRASYQYSEQELTDSAKRQQRTLREDLDVAIKENSRLAQDLGVAADRFRNPDFINDPRNNDLSEGIQDEELKAELNTIRAELILIDDLIARIVDPVIRQDLVNLRQELVNSTLQRLADPIEKLGETLQEHIANRAALGSAPEAQWSKQAGLRVDASRRLRSGIVVSPFSNLNYNASNYVGKDSYEKELGGMGSFPIYKAELGFDVMVPLRRGRGQESVAATETAAKESLEVSRLLLLHQESRSVLRTVQAYWGLRGALDQVEVLRRSVRLQESLLTMTQALITAEELPGMEESRIRASLADAEAQLEAAERRVHEAQIGLAQVMGVALEDLSTAPVASDALPAPLDTLTTEAAALDGLASQAVERRRDHAAATRSREAASVLLRAAQLDTRRLVNLSLRFWGNSIGEESPDLGSWVFRSARAGLQVEAPLGNNALEGRHDQQAARLKRTDIDRDNLERTIRLNVLRLAESLRVAAARVQSTEAAVGFYDKTIADEQEKLKLGESTLIDTITTEQQTTAARLTRVAALQTYARLLTQLRFETGLLLNEEDGKTSVSEDSLLAVPPSLQGAGTSDR